MTAFLKGAYDAQMHLQIRKSCCSPRWVREGNSDFSYVFLIQCLSDRIGVALFACRYLSHVLFASFSKIGRSPTTHRRYFYFIVPYNYARRKLCPMVAQEHQDWGRETPKFCVTWLAKKPPLMKSPYTRVQGKQGVFGNPAIQKS